MNFVQESHLLCKGKMLVDEEENMASFPNSGQHRLRQVSKTPNVAKPPNSILRKSNNLGPSSSTVRFKLNHRDSSDSEHENTVADRTPVDPYHRSGAQQQNMMSGDQQRPIARTTDRVTKTTFRNLERQCKGLAEKIDELGDQFTNRAKDKNLRKMIHSLSSFVFALLLGGILYGNYLMLIPHLNAVAMAILLSVVLSSIKTEMIYQLEELQIHLQKTPVFIAIIAMSTTGIIALLNDVAVAGTGWLATFMGLVGLIIALVDARSLTAALLTFFVICAIFVPLYFAFQQCAREVEFLTKYLLKLIHDDEALRALVDSILSSNVYVAMRKQITAMFGEDSLPADLNSTVFKEDIKADVRRMAVLAGTNLERFSVNILNLVTNLSNVMWGFTTFSTTLFYLLSNESPWAMFNALSPLSPQDNAELYESMKMSTSRILLCSTCIGFLHGGLMYVILSLAGFEIVAIPSFLCGAMASLPLWGTHVVFVPVALALWAHDARVAAVFVCVVELVMMLVVDARITAFIPGDRHFVGLSIVAGLYAFGALGFLYGPLLIGLTSSFVAIYLKHLHNPLAEDIFSPAPVRRKLLFSSTPSSTPM